MLGTLVFIAISIGVVCVVVLLASRNKELLQRVLFWAGVGAAFLALVYIFLGFEQYDSIKGVALGIVALTLLVASKHIPLSGVDNQR